jgi:hypothetical protein
MRVSPVMWCIEESMRPGASLLPKARHPWTNTYVHASYHFVGGLKPRF